MDSTTLLVVILLIFIAVFVFPSIEKNKGKKILEASGFNTKKILRFDTLLGGHPDINDGIKNGYLVSNGNDLSICDKHFKILGIIQRASVNNVVFEDATTFEKRISAGRLLLVGVFALAWRKKTKNEQGFVTIEWNDGRFDHSTAFVFEGAGSANEANSFRNALIKWAR